MVSLGVCRPLEPYAPAIFGLREPTSCMEGSSSSAECSHGFPAQNTAHVEQNMGRKASQHSSSEAWNNGAKLGGINDFGLMPVDGG